jgi:hypothetical protein
MVCIIVTAEGDSHLHIFCTINSGITLCGFTDVPYKEVEGEPNCPACLEIVKFCKKIKLN